MSWKWVSHKSLDSSIARSGSDMSLNFGCYQMEKILLKNGPGISGLGAVD